MEKKTRRSFLRNAGLGGTVVLGVGAGSGSAAAESSTAGDSLADATSDWPAFRGGPARSGSTSTSGPVAAPTARHLGQSGPSIDSNLAVVDGVAYFVQNHDRPSAVAFDLDREMAVWQTDVTPGSMAGVTVAGGTVYVVGGSQHAPECVPVPPTLTALSTDDGSVEWEYAFDPVTVTWPTVVDDRTYVVADDSLVAIEDGGTVAWRTDLADGTAANRSLVPAVADGLVVVADEAGVVALDAGDGSEAWRAELPDAAHATVADGVVYVTARNAVVAFDLADGTEQWRAVGSPSAGGADPSGEPAVDSERVYVPMDEAYVAAFSTADGSLEWRSDGVGGVSVAVGGDTVYAAVSDPSARELAVHALSGTDGAERWTHEPESHFPVQAPVIADGALLFGGDALTVLTE